MRKASLLVLLFCLVSQLSFASQLWQFTANGAVSAKPVVLNGAVVIASDDGYIYALEPTTGVKRWATFVGQYPNEVFVFDNSIVTSTTGGKVVKLSPAGTPLWTVDMNTTNFNVSYIYGATANDKNIFVVTNIGVFMFDKVGNLSAVLTMYNDSVASPPGAAPGYVVFGKGNQLFKVSDGGAILWTTTLKTGSFWFSRPVIVGNNIYVGALDNSMHEYSASNGEELWSAPTRGWVAGTPLVEPDAVYFGSDDGEVYAVDPTSGNLLWATQTQLAVQTQPEIGTMGGQNVVFVGGSDKSIYAMSTQDGSIVWKGPAASVVGSPLFYQNAIYVGSGDGIVQAFSSERACSITSPHEADIIGLKEVVVSGNYVSAAGGATVSVQVNGNAWQPANTTDVYWVYYLDPNATFNAGLNVISCKVTDSAGDENGPTYTSVTVNHDPNAQPSNLVVTVSPNIMEKQNFSVFVNDGDDGSPVDRFSLSYGNTNVSGDKNVSLVINDPGTYQLTVRKIGFNDAQVSVTVNSNGVNPVLLAVGAIVIIVVLWKIVGTVRKKPARRR